jgi:hypothetical protein
MDEEDNGRTIRNRLKQAFLCGLIVFSFVAPPQGQGCTHTDGSLDLHRQPRAYFQPLLDGANMWVISLIAFPEMLVAALPFLWILRRLEMS